MKERTHRMKVLNEKGEIVELPPGDYLAVGHVHPGDPVKPCPSNRNMWGFWGRAPGPCGYYDAYYWNAEEQRAYFVIGCPESASHMQPDVGKASLRVEAARQELAMAILALEAIARAKGQ